MLIPSPSGLMKAILGLVVAVGVAIPLLSLKDAPATALRIDAVTVAKAASGPFALRVSGAGLAPGTEAMLIPDLQGASQAEALTRLNVPLYHLASDGRLAVAATRGQRLLTLEVTSDRRVRTLGGIKLSPSLGSFNDSPVSFITLVGSRAVVGRSNFGLLLIDLADPEEPRETDQVALPGNFLDAESRGGVVYVASQKDGLLLVAIDNGRLRVRPVAGTGALWRLAVNGRHLVTASQKGEVTLFELDREGWPRPLGTAHLSLELRDLALAGDTLYVSAADGRLKEFSLANWPRPTLRGECELGGKPLWLEWDSEGRQLFCALVGRGVAVVDGGRQGAPTVAGVLAMSRSPNSLRVAGRRLFAVGVNGLQIFPLETLPIATFVPEIVHQFPLFNGKVDLFRWRGAVFAYDRRELAQVAEAATATTASVRESWARAPLLALADTDGLRLHPLRNGLPDAQAFGKVPIDDPRVARPGTDGYPVRGTHWQNGRLYVLSPSRLGIFLCDAAAAPTLIGEYPFAAEAKALAWIEPGFVVVSFHQKGLEVIDVRNPAAPARVAEYPTPVHLKTVGAIQDLLADGQRLYVSRARLGVEIFDLANPAAPTLLQRIDTPGSAGQLSLEDGVLAVGDQDKGVFLVDVRGKFGVPIGSYPLPILPGAVLSDQNRLFVVNAAGDVMRFTAPHRLAAGGGGGSDEAEWLAPGEIPPGRYSLMLYGPRGRAQFPVTLP